MNKYSAFFLITLAAVYSAVSCQSELLSTPPSSVNVALLSPPTETLGSDTVTIAFITNESATVSVDYGTVSGTYTKSVPRTTAAGTEHTVSLADLSPATTYFYRILIWPAGRTPIYGDEYSFTTDTAVPVVPVILSLVSDPVVVPGNSVLGITFESNQVCTSVVEYGTVPGTYTNGTLQTSTPSTAHTASLTGLSPGTVYYYRVKLYWDSGSDYTSAEYSGTTTSEAAPTSAQKSRGVWILGGLSGSTIATPVSNVDLYDPVTNIWYPAVTSLPTPVSFAGYAAAEGKLFVIGGFNSAGVAQNTVQIYTISTGLWSTGASILAARANIYATASNGKIYILGGTQTIAGGPLSAMTTTYQYSISGDEWINKTAFGVANIDRFNYAYNDVIYNIAGRTNFLTISTTAHDAYVPASNLLSTGVTEVAIPTNRTGVAGALYVPSSGPAAIILVGGVSALTGTNGNFVNQGTTTATLQSLTHFLAYPFALPSAWTIPNTGATIYPSTIAYGSAVVPSAATPDRFYYFGGVTALGTTTTVVAGGYWCATPNTSSGAWNGTWTATANMPTARWGHGAVTLNQ
jgi:hypothetical protein